MSFVLSTHFFGVLCEERAAAKEVGEAELESVVIEGAPNVSRRRGSCPVAMRLPLRVSYSRLGVEEYLEGRGGQEVYWGRAGGGPPCAPEEGKGGTQGHSFKSQPTHMLTVVWRNERGGNFTW
jgi:hypothetical protein